MPALLRPAAPTPKPKANRPWAVTAITWLLLIEMAGFLVLAYVNVERLTAWALAALAILALVAAVGFARARRGGWVNAVLAQGGGLTLALWVYFRTHAPYAYPIMLGGILMVLYLHQADVLAAFRLAPGDEPGPP